MANFDKSSCIALGVNSGTGGGSQGGLMGTTVDPAIGRRWGVSKTDREKEGRFDRGLRGGSKPKR